MLHAYGKNILMFATAYFVLLMKGLCAVLLSVWGKTYFVYRKVILEDITKINGVNASVITIRF